MIKLFGIAGSPRRGGNSDILLDEVLRGAKDAGSDAEKIVAASMKIAPCNECGSCNSTGECIIDDDMQMVYQKLRDADRIILATPVFFAGVSAHAKMLIDRCQALWARKYLLGKSLQKEGPAIKREGMLISVAAAKGSTVFDCVMKTAKYFYLAIDVDYKHNLLYDNIEKKGDIKRHQTALRDAYEKGRVLGKENTI